MIEGEENQYRSCDLCIHSGKGSDTPPCDECYGLEAKPDQRNHFDPSGALDRRRADVSGYQGKGIEECSGKLEIEVQLGVDNLELYSSVYISEQMLEAMRGVFEKERSMVFDKLDKEEEALIAKERALFEHLENVEDYEESPEGLLYTHVDRRDGTKYALCVSCERVMWNIESSHSAGECNLCHAVNKDD